MNINNISEGQIFKNYKELCLELGMEIQSNTNSKNSQLKELNRYCKMNKVGHKFIIEEIYSNPLPKVENRGKSEGSRNNNNIYGETIQLLILDLLAQCRNGKVSISRGKLMLVINMINCNFRPCGEQVQKLSKYTDIDESVIYDFYNTSNSNFKSAVEIALRNLMDKRVIWYDIVTKVCEIGTKVHRLASDEEKESIMECEKKVLDELGYKQLSKVRISKDWKLFRMKVQTELSKQSIASYYYQAYDIVVNEKYLEEERKELYDLLLIESMRNQYKNKLNETVSSNLIENAKKRQDKEKTTTKRIREYRTDDDYISNITRLVDILINNRTDDISESIENIKLGKCVLSEEELLELEYADLFA